MHKTPKFFIGKLTGDAQNKTEITIKRLESNLEIFWGGIDGFIYLSK